MPARKDRLTQPTSTAGEQQPVPLSKDEIAALAMFDDEPPVTTAPAVNRLNILTCAVCGTRLHSGDMCASCDADDQVQMEMDRDRE